MLTQVVRTTISLPVDLHDDLKRLAFEARKSMGEVLVEKLRPKFKGGVNQRKNDWLLFDEVAKKGKKVDLVSELRKDRGRDDS